MPKDDNGALRFFITAIITVICLSISFYQVTIGYRDLAGSYLVSGSISLVVVLILFYLAFEIRENRRRGEGIATYLIAYLAFVLFSFAGNFNAFYTQFMKGELLKAELTQKYDDFVKLREDAKVSLSNYSNEAPGIHQLVAQLESQIMNPSEPGCGPKCEAVLSDLEAKLNTKITRLKSEDKEYLVSAYSKLVNEILKSNMERAKGPEKESLLTAIDHDVSIFHSEMESAMQDPANKALGLIGVIVEKYKDYGKQIRTLTGPGFVFDEQMKLNNAEIGRLSFTFKSAKENVDNWGTWIAAFLSLFVDMFVPLFILLVTKPSDRDFFKGSGSKLRPTVLP
jgi:hypothetical protein